MSPNAVVSPPQRVARLRMRALLTLITLAAACAEQPTAVPDARSPRVPSAAHDDDLPFTETGHVYLCKNGVPGASYDFSYTASTTPPTVGSMTVVVPECNLIWDVASQGEADLSITELPSANSNLVEVEIDNGILGMALDKYVAPPGGTLNGQSFPVHATAGEQLLAGFNNVTTCPATILSSNFNASKLAEGTSVWFNAVLTPSGVTAAGGFLLLNGGSVTFTANHASYVVTLPPSVIAFSPTATTATTTFDGARWLTTVPWNYTGNIFLGGTAYQVPAGGLPGGIHPVMWSESMSTNIAELKVEWKWAAAVYSSLSNLNALGVKPVDAKDLSEYLNGHHAGTPENFDQYVIPGARGGGGANFTGSYTGSAKTTPCLPE